MSIILVGYMACGKSSVGKKISEKLNIKFQDTDIMIEENNNFTVSEIFSSKGEEYFRDEETRILRRLLELDLEEVIATGGGMPVREENRELLKKIGTVIYLKTNVDEILKRVEYDTTRPLLVCDDKRVHIQKMLDKRHPLYMDVADIVIDTVAKNVDELVNEIINILKK